MKIVRQIWNWFTTYIKKIKDRKPENWFFLAKVKWFEQNVLFAGVYVNSQNYVSYSKKDGWVRHYGDLKDVDTLSQSFLDAFVGSVPELYRHQKNAQRFFNLLSLYRQPTIRKMYHFNFVFSTQVDVVNNIIRKDEAMRLLIQGINKEIISHEDFMTGYQKGYDDCIADIRSGKLTQSEINK